MCVYVLFSPLLTGVYLPSNPDSVLLEIDYQSGRPMQRYVRNVYETKKSTYNTVLCFIVQCSCTEKMSDVSIMKLIII